MEQLARLVIGPQDQVGGADMPALAVIAIDPAHQTVGRLVKPPTVVSLLEIGFEVF